MDLGLVAVGRVLRRPETYIVTSCDGTRPIIIVVAEWQSTRSNVPASRVRTPAAAAVVPVFLFFFVAAHELYVYMYEKRHDGLVLYSNYHIYYINAYFFHRWWHEPEAMSL